MNMSFEMETLYTDNFKRLLVALSIPHVTYALSIALDTMLNLESPAVALRLSVLTCDSACGCLPACVEVNYSDGRLYCDLFQQNRAEDHSLYFEGRIGFLRQEKNVLTDDVSEPTKRECSSVDLPKCPDLVMNGTTVVLHNLTMPRTQCLVQLVWSSGPDGWQTASCTRYSNCTHYDSRTTRSTMRDASQQNSECVDAESECRDGQCWCIPGLSHDPDTLSCIALCPGQYGQTFQIVNKAFISLDKTEHRIYYLLRDLQMCLDNCLQDRELVCKYGYFHKYRGYCSFDLHAKADRTVSNVWDFNDDGSFVLQRDCKRQVG